MRAPATVNGGISQHWTMLNGTPIEDLSRENSKSGSEYGDGELKPVVNGQANGIDGATANERGGDEDEYLALVNELSFKDDKHKDLLLTRLNTFRRNRELCDVVLLVDKREIFAHKAVLAAVSPTLFELFTQFSNGIQQQQRDESPSKSGDVKEKQEPANGQGQATENLSSPAYFEFNDVDYDCFDALISYAYSGSLEIWSKKVADLYKTASRFRMQSCALACAKYLVQQLSPQNCIGFRKCANRANDSILASKVDAYIQKNFSEIFQSSKEFLALPSVQIEVVLCVKGERSDSASSMRDERRLSERVLEWLQRRVSDLPDHAVFRMEMLTEKTHMLYLDDDMTLQDCRDMDNNSGVGSSDLIQDYKKSSRRSSVQMTSIPKTRSRSNVPMLPSPGPKQMGRVSSTESVSSLTSEGEEVEWKVVAVQRTSDNYCTALAVIRRQLAALSIHVIDGGPILANGLVDQKLSSQQSEAEVSAPLAAMEIPRCSVGAVSMRGKLLVCGGYDRGECLNSVEQYDPATNAWTKMPSMSKERGRFDAKVVDNKVFACGGSDGAKDLNTAERFDPEEKKWTKIAPMLNARSNHGVASADGFVYAIGGCQWQRPLKHCERYDCLNDSWTPIAPLQHARYQAGCCALSTEIVAVGGFDTWSCTNSVECYDPETNTWRSLPPLGVARRGCGVAVLKDQLFVVGGSDGTQALNSVEVLDLTDPQAAWRPGPPLNTPRDNVRAAVVSTDDGERIFAVGGFNGKSFLNSIEFLDEATHEWRTTVLKQTSANGSAHHEPEEIHEGQS